MNARIPSTLCLSFLLLADTAFAAERDAVVQIGGCTGVCVHPQGIILSAKRCQHPHTITIEINGRSITAERVFTTSDPDGPVAYLAKNQTKLPWIPLARTVPPPGARVSSEGWPSRDNRRVYQRAAGTIVNGVHLRYQGQRLPVNLTTLRTAPGWSGGPLLNDRGEVCGLLHGGNPQESYFISFAATKKAYDAAVAAMRAPEIKQRMYVFTSATCIPCQRFKQDFESDATFRAAIESRFSVVMVDVNEQPQLARDYHVTAVPTFLVPGLSNVTAYEGKAWLLAKLSSSGNAPKPPARRDLVVEPEMVDWSDVQVIVLIAEQPSGAIRGRLREKALSLANGTIERRLSDATQGKADVLIIAQRIEPERYSALADAAGIGVNRLAVVVLVARQSLGLKGLIASRLEDALRDRLGRVPIDVIFERAHPEDYAAVRDALFVVDEQAPEPSFPTGETALGGLLAILTERVRLVGRIVSWFRRSRRGRIDPDPAA